MMSVSNDLQPPRPGRHQAEGRAGEQRQVLGGQEDRRAGRSVGEQQVAAIQRSDATRSQRCGGEGEVGVFRETEEGGGGGGGRQGGGGLAEAKQEK